MVHRLTPHVSSPPLMRIAAVHVGPTMSNACKHSKRATPKNHPINPWRQPVWKTKAKTFHLPLDFQVCDRNRSKCDTGEENFQTSSDRSLSRIFSGDVQNSDLCNVRCRGMPRMISWSGSICLNSVIFFIVDLRGDSETESSSMPASWPEEISFSASRIWFIPSGPSETSGASPSLVQPGLICLASITSTPAPWYASPPLQQLWSAPMAEHLSLNRNTVKGTKAKQVSVSSASFFHVLLFMYFFFCAVFRTWQDRKSMKHQQKYHFFGIKPLRLLNRNREIFRISWYPPNLEFDQISWNSEEELVGM